MTDLFEEFQGFRRILCVCPCCGELVRVSELQIKPKGSAVKTWLDDYDKQTSLLEKDEQVFDEKEEKLRGLARERGRIEAEKVFNTAISPAFKALKLDPFDVKPILNPIDFIVFKGMNKGSISDVVLLSKACNILSLNATRRQIEQVVQDKKYEWQVVRISEEGSIIFEGKD